MADDVLEIADKLWRGEIDIVEIHPVGGYLGGMAEVATGRRLRALASPTSPPSPPTTGSSWSTPARASWPGRSTRRCGGGRRSGSTPPSTPTATSTTSSGSRCGRRRPATKGWPAPTVVAHEALPARFDRYIVTAGLQRRHQPAAVRRAGPAVAHRVPLSRPDLRAAARARRGRRGLRAAPRPGRDRRPHLDVGARPAACCAAATSSSGRRPTPATPRRCSATRASGPSPCAR